MTRARMFRKALGGGMRQAGILAAAGLIALEEMPKRLGEDHANARLLAECVAKSPRVAIDLEAVQSNIVIFELKDGGDAPGFVGRLKRWGVLASAIGPSTIRFVTHYDVNREACERAAEIVNAGLRAIA
jgi:threonine aldolase